MGKGGSDEAESTTTTSQTNSRSSCANSSGNRHANQLNTCWRTYKLGAKRILDDIARAVNSSSSDRPKITYSQHHWWVGRGPSNQGKDDRALRRLAASDAVR